MDHRDMTGIGAAFAALVLAIAGWLISPAPRTEPPAIAWAMPAAPEEHGLDRWLDRLTEPGPQLARN